MKRTTFEEVLIAQAKEMVGDSESKWMDAMGQSGPAPSDLGEHEPIPEEAVRSEPVAMVAVEAKARKLRVRADGDTFFPTSGKEEV